ncbi:hypothetical protein D3C72_638350 [compost metagenome]
MTASDNIKELLNAIYGEADWKRISKSRINSNYELREFREPKSGVTISAYTHVESQIHQLYNGAKILFGIAQDEDDLVVRFAEPFYLKANWPSENLAGIFPFIGKTIPGYLRHATGDLYQCHAGLHSRDQLVADLVVGGFTFDLSVANDLNEDYGGPVYGVPTVASILATQPPLPSLSDDDDDEDDDLYADWKSGETIYFGVHDGPDGIAASFAPKAQWERDGHLFDQHVGDILDKLGYKMPSYIGGEDMENCFGVWEPGQGTMQRPPTVTKQKVITDLSAAGFVFLQDLDDLINP